MQCSNGSRRSHRTPRRHSAWLHRRRRRWRTRTARSPPSQREQKEPSSRRSCLVQPWAEWSLATLQVHASSQLKTPSERWSSEPPTRPRAVERVKPLSFERSPPSSTTASPHSNEPAPVAAGHSGRVAGLVRLPHETASPTCRPRCRRCSRTIQARRPTLLDDCAKFHALDVSGICVASHASPAYAFCQRVRAPGSRTYLPCVRQVHTRGRAPH